MGKFMKNLSLVPKGLRYKLLIAFSLMAIIPLLVCGYLIKDYIFPPQGDILYISLILFFTIIITVLGMVFAKRMIYPVIEMAIDARLIAEGDIERKIKVYQEDEIGELGKSINKITTNIKENMEELKLYEERTKEINTEIHKKVLSLSSLLKIGELIAQSTNLDEIFGMIMEKTAQIRDGGFAALFLIDEKGEQYVARSVFELGLSRLKALKVSPQEGFLGRIIPEGRIVIFDSSSRISKDAETFAREFDLKNFVLAPILIRRNLVGFIISGNYRGKDFYFKEDDLEIVKIYSKQVALALENSLLSEKVKILSIRDELTGLYNEPFIINRLKEEIERAIIYQRPCSFIVIDVDNFEKFKKSSGALAAEDVLRKISEIILGNITQIGKAARLEDDKFAMLIPEKNKREATQIAEAVRKGIEKASSTGNFRDSIITVSIGVSENPLDGATAEDVIKKAYEYTRKAKAEGKNKIKSN